MIRQCLISKWSWNGMVSIQCLVLCKMKEHTLQIESLLTNVGNSHFIGRPWYHLSSPSKIHTSEQKTTKYYYGKEKKIKETSSSIEFLTGWISPLCRNGGDFFELVAMRKTWRGPDCASHVREKHCYSVVVCHLASPRHRRLEWKCPLFGMGAFRNLLPRWRRNSGKGRDHSVGRR